MAGVRGITGDAPRLAHTTLPCYVQVGGKTSPHGGGKEVLFIHRPPTDVVLAEHSRLLQHPSGGVLDLGLFRVWAPLRDRHTSAVLRQSVFSSLRGAVFTAGVLFSAANQPENVFGSVRKSASSFPAAGAPLIAWKPGDSLETW